jgi:hypothetical protein
MTASQARDAVPLRDAVPGRGTYRVRDAVGRGGRGAADEPMNSGDNRVPKPGTRYRIIRLFPSSHVPRPARWGRKETPPRDAVGRGRIFQS